MLWKPFATPPFGSRITGQFQASPTSYQYPRSDRPTRMYPGPIPLSEHCARAVTLNSTCVRGEFIARINASEYKSGIPATKLGLSIAEINPFGRLAIDAITRIENNTVWRKRFCTMIPREGLVHSLNSVDSSLNV